MLINGGTKAYGALAVVGVQGEIPFTGLPNTSIFDPGTESFVDVTPTAHGRWYPTVTEMNDGRMMTTGGLNDTDGNYNNTTEIWDGTQWGAEIPGNPHIDNFPTFGFPLYPRMHLLPTGHIFYSAPSSATLDFNPTNQTWTLVAWTIYPGLHDPNGERTYGSSVLLPLTPQNNYNPKVMILGGDNPGTDTTELIDLSPAGFQISADCPTFAPCWVQGPKMAQARVEMEATILPNGKLLVDGGSALDEDATTASMKAEIYDPATNSFSSAGSNAFPRLYHNVQLLLPDATVAITGGNPAQGVFENHIEIYQPAYLFNSDGTLATRPDHRQRARFGQLRRFVQRSNSGRSQHRIRGSDESRFGNPFIRYGPALRRLVVHDCFGKPHRERTSEFQHCSSGILHAVPGQQGGNSFARELGKSFRSGGSDCQCRAASGASAHAALCVPKEACHRVGASNA